ncbi:MAG: anaerobic ribonucleoside-triphosphate reductase activating protein [bacterium]|nr:anaerobic ribonucleoside-triphosphate reductase activating protein [bacterium]
MKIKGLQKFTLIDYPQKLACTIFIAGCNFFCPFCHNSELVCPEKIEQIREIPEQEIFDFLKQRKKFLEGVCITGGEPTLNKEIIDFVQKIKKLGYSVKIDTNGSNPTVIESLLKRGLIDYVAMDIKAPKNRYLEITRSGIGENVGDLIEQSIALLRNSNIDFEFRTTVVPELLNKEDILEIAKWIKGSRRYYLQNFIGAKTVDPYFESVKPYPDDYLVEIRNSIAPFFEVCEIRNI